MKTKAANRPGRTLRIAAAAAALVAACTTLALAGQDQPTPRPSLKGPAAQPQPQQPGQTQPQPPPPAQTQQPAPDQQPLPVFHARTEEVIVPVLVRNRSGDPILNLGIKDFRIFEDNVEQKVSGFRNEPIPLSVVFLVDDDLPDKAAQMVDRSLTAVLGGMAEADEMAVVKFAEYPRTVLDFGSDQDKLYTVLKRTDVSGHFTVPAGQAMTLPPTPLNNQAAEIGVPERAQMKSQITKNLDDAVLYCAEMLHDRSRDNRKVLLIVSDGRNSHNNTAKYGQVVRALLSSDVSVYGVGVSEAVLDRKRADIGKYVDVTGGDVFYAGSRNSLEEHYTHILEESRNRYTLTYVPTGTDRSKEFHEIEVRVERPGLKVRARDGYYVLIAKK